VITAPVAIIAFRPAVLPVFDPRWKDKCLSCANRVDRATAKRRIAMQCSRGTKVSGGHDTRRQDCIDMRTSGACGPDAVLWRAA
jgi:hypothetical protein